MIRFTIIGEPKAKARPRFSKHGVYTDRKTVEYENLVRLSFLEQVGQIEPIQTAVKADIRAFFPIPSSWSKKKQRAAANGFIDVQKKPDCDNIAKVVLDALNGIAYMDDKQITELKVTKQYSTRPMVEVHLWTDL